MITVKSVSPEKWKELAVIFVILSMKHDDINIPKFIQSKSWRRKKKNYHKNWKPDVVFSVVDGMKKDQIFSFPKEGDFHQQPLLKHHLIP